MDNNLLARLLKLRKWISGHKSIAAAFLAVIMAGGAFGGVMAFEHNQNMHIGATTGDISVSQSVYFNGTNANLNPITYGGASYSTSTPLYTQIGPSVTAHGPQSVTTSFSFGNFEPGDYLMMTVNLTNTGHTVLLLNSTGVDVAIFASITLSNGTTLINDSVSLPLGELFSGHANTPSTVMGYLSSSQSSGLLDNFGQYLPDSELWIAGFSPVNNTPIPQYLEPGATFSYTLWVGLGTNATNLYGSSTVLSVGVPMIPSR